jgi:SAM-dependent methyltransferase
MPSPRPPFRSKPYRSVVAQIVNRIRPRSILDAPSGCGWLRAELAYEADVDGIDLFADAPPGYRTFLRGDLEQGVPSELPDYECAISCEGLEHLASPATFLASLRRHLAAPGLLILTTPSVWFPDARLQYLLRGFFPGFPSLAGPVEPGTHMHVTPCTFPQIYLMLRLQGFRDIRLHDVPERKPRHLYELPLGVPQLLYCHSRRRAAKTEEERVFWTQAMTRQSIYGRRLVVSASAG